MVYRKPSLTPGTLHRKKILYISYDGMTDPLGQSQVIPYLKGLSQHGYEFTIISFEKKEKLRANGELIRSIMSAAGIDWQPRIFSHRLPLISKMYDLYQMRRLAGKLHRKKNFDFIHCRSYVPAEAAMQLWKRSSVPFLFDMRGFWVDERVDNGQWDLNKPLYRRAYNVFKKKEKNYFREAAHIISLTNKGEQELISRYKVPPEKITVIPCCVDLELFDYNLVSDAEKNTLREQLGIEPGQKIISYLGSLGGWYLTSEMLDFFRVLKQNVSNVRFLFITHDAREGILSKAALAGIDTQDIIVQPAKRTEVRSLLSLSEWSLFFIKDAYSKKASSPTKQGEIMAMGIPIICNDIGDTGQIIVDSKAGLVVSELTTEGYKRVIDNLSSCEHMPKESIRSAAYKYYDLKNGTEQYRQVYEKMSR